MNPHNPVTSRAPADLSNKRVGGAGCCSARVAGAAQVAVGGRQTEPSFWLRLRFSSQVLGGTTIRDFLLI